MHPASPLTSECFPGGVSVFAAGTASSCLEKRRKIGQSSVVFPEARSSFALGELCLFHFPAHQRV